jgi:hypothetical protein
MKPVHLLLVAHRSHHDHLSTLGLPHNLYGDPVARVANTLHMHTEQNIAQSCKLFNFMVTNPRPGVPASPIPCSQSEVQDLSYNDQSV